MPKLPLRRKLELAVKYFAILSGLLLAYVLLDSWIDFRPASVQDSYRFKLSRLESDKPVILQQDNLAIVVIRRSAETLGQLQRDVGGLQDPESLASEQPEAAANRLRSIYPEFFVAYALGTDLGCRLEVGATELREICGQARYDFAGRALIGNNKFPNLVIPDYNFASDFNTLTIRP